MGAHERQAEQIGRRFARGVRAARGGSGAASSLAGPPGPSVPVDLVGRDLHEPRGLSAARPPSSTCTPPHVRAEKRPGVEDDAVHVGLRGEVRDGPRLTRRGEEAVDQRRVGDVAPDKTVTPAPPTRPADSRGGPRTSERSTLTTRQPGPASSRRRTKWLPMNPQPPVTRTVVTARAPRTRTRRRGPRGRAAPGPGLRGPARGRATGSRARDRPSARRAPPPARTRP